MTNQGKIGAAFGALGMVSFSLTLPATRAAVGSLNPWVVAFGRPVAAGVCSAIVLAITRQRLPARRYWKQFALVALGAGIGVPLTFAWGMHALPAAHGAITLGLLPLATALLAAIRAGERPSRKFWLATLVGSTAVLIYAWSSGAGRIGLGDIILLLSVLASAVAYEEGARLTRVYPGWQVMCWSLVMAAPLEIGPLIWAVRTYGVGGATPLSWAGLAYIALVSQWLGMFAWFKGLAAGGIARIGQLQLLQPFCTLAFAAVLLHETVTISMLVAAVVVVGAVAVGSTAAVEVPAFAGEPGD